MVVVFVIVALLVLALLGAVHWYVWRRLVRDTTAPGGLPRRLGTALLVVLPLTSVGALVAGRAGAPFAVERAFAWPGYVWLALLLYLTLALLVGEAVRPLLLRVRFARRGGGGAEAPDGGRETEPVRAPESVREPEPVSEPEPVRGPEPEPVREPEPEPVRAGAGSAVPSPSRRLFVARGVAVAAATVAAGTVGHGMYGVLRGPRLKQVTIPLAKLGRQAHGYRIAVVSDIHLGPILGRAHTQRIVDTINGVQPDLIAIVGDLVDGSVADLGPAAEPLARLRARHGSFFVTGNHEYFSGAAQWLDHVRELGLRPLENARVELPGFDLAGVNDIAGERQEVPQGPDFAKALGDRDRARAAVLLAHQPVVIHDAVEHGVDLQLSGHTHGGQLWPGNYLAELANPTLAGLERYGDTQLYVTRGAGAWGPPVRVGAESDITVVTLASRQT
ncbi:metallophosphoesterase [Streptomyces sp. URMC 123]|uniref:metallophosphoesterase n=1 Tax=Streptomyces sp. URMC 123 TaxID=3423403 RepID=UPI003F1B47E3